MNCEPGEGKPLTIITGSADDLAIFASSDALKRIGSINEWCCHDCRSVLTTDALKRVGHTHDFSVPAVQQAIIAQPGFFLLIDDLLRAALGDKTDIVRVPSGCGRRMFLHDKYGNQICLLYTSDAADE